MFYTLFWFGALNWSYWNFLMKKNLAMVWNPSTKGLGPLFRGFQNYGLKHFCREEVHCKPSLEGFETGIIFTVYRWRPLCVIYQYICLQTTFSCNGGEENANLLYEVLDRLVALSLCLIYCSPGILANSLICSFLILSKV